MLKQLGHRWPLMGGVLTCLVLSACVATAQQDTPPPSAIDDAAEKEIRALVDSFVQSFKQRDAAAIAAMWTSNGVFINENGERFSGRETIQAEYEALFKDAPAELEMRVAIDSIHFIDPQTAVQKGRAASVPQPAGQVRVMSRYTAIHVKQQGKWFLAHLQDTQVEVPPKTGKLEDLERIVGSWQASNQDASLEVTCRWIENKKFLERTHIVTKSGEVTSSGRQIIGFDPGTGLISSWSFNNDGSHSRGTWSPDKKGWLIEVIGSLSDGTETRATNLLSFQDADSLLWVSRERSVGDTLLRDTEPVTLTRK